MINSLCSNNQQTEDMTLQTSASAVDLISLVYAPIHVYHKDSEAKPKVQPEFAKSTQEGTKTISKDYCAPISKTRPLHPNRLPTMATILAVPPKKIPDKFSYPSPQPSVSHNNVVGLEMPSKSLQSCDKVS